MRADGYKWDQIGKKHGISSEAARSRYKTYQKNKGTGSRAVVSVETEPVSGPAGDTGKRIEKAMKAARGPVSVYDLADMLDCGPRTIRDRLEALIEGGYPVTEVSDGTYYWPSVPAPTEGKHAQIPESGQWRKFALIGDTHGGSAHEQLVALHEFYDLCVREGVQVVFHAGDITHGLQVYTGQYQDLKPIGWGYEEQSQYVARTYPRREGITTYFICGNHDEDATKHGAADPGNRIAAERADLKYLGMYTGTIDYEGLRVQLQHGSGGEAYSRSYKIQKLLERLPRVELFRHPHIMGMGHYHTFVMLPDYQSVDAFLVGAFEGRNNLLRRLGIYPTPGGWIMEARVDGERIVDMKFRVVKYTFEDKHITESLLADGSAYR